MLRGCFFLLFFLGIQNLYGQSNSFVQHIHIYSDAALDVPRILDLFNVKTNDNYSQIETERRPSSLSGNRTLSKYIFKVFRAKPNIKSLFNGQTKSKTLKFY